MKIFFGLLLGCFSFISFGQEKQVFTIDWQTLDTQLLENDFRYTIAHQEIIPSLSFLKPVVQIGKHQLMEINLAVDIRKAHLKNETPILLLPENKFIQSEYSIALPSEAKANLNFTITGNGGYSSRNVNPGGLKNNAYKDAGEYARVYCPVTGLPLN